MPIYRLLRETSFDQDAINLMAAAYEAALDELQIRGRMPAAELLAGKIIDIAKMGERDPLKIKERALRYMNEGRTLWDQR